MDPSTSSSLNMKTTCHHLEDPSYFEDAVSMQVSKDGQIQMVNWLSRDDRPWTGLHDTTLETQPQALPNYLTDRATHDSFMEYRSTGMPSECETIPGDSGYGSCFPPSVENTSVYGEEPFPPAQDVEQDLSSFHLSMQDTMHMDTPCETGKAQGIATKALQSPDANILCPECGNWVKTRSELKKHELRHKKPFPCPYPGCKRHINGFASRNDVVRHQMTVHKKHDMGKTYICCHAPCAKKDRKPWPRADNFRSHLYRVHNITVHADDDLSKYLYHTLPNPIAEDLSGVGTNLDDPLGSSGGRDMIVGHGLAHGSIGEFPEIPNPGPASHNMLPAAQSSLYDDKLLMPPPPSNNLPRAARQTVPQDSQDHRYQVDEDISTSHPVAGTYGRERATIGSPDSLLPTKTELMTPHTGYGRSTGYQDVSDMETESNPSVHEDSDSDSKEFQKRVLQHGTFQDGNPVAPALSTNLDQPEVMDILRKLPKHILEKALEGATENTEQADTASLPGSQGKQSCSFCTKTFVRPCELRKHLKRHERPYGCTVYGCDKKFGSKNDWKRHENGQHNQHDVWHCDKGCGKFFLHRERFESHLRTFHQMTKEVAIQEKLESNRRGSHCSESFWCGFCQTLVPVDRGVNLIDKRFDHIDDHFMGRQGSPKQKIEDWRHHEEIMDRPTRNGEASRKRKLSRQADGRPAKQLHTMSS